MVTNNWCIYIYRLTKVNYFVHSARNSLGVAALYPARHTDMLWTKSVQFPQRTKNEFPHGYGGYGFLTHGSSFVPLFTVGRYRIIPKPCGWSESSGDSVVDKDVIGSIEVCVKNFREHLCKAVVVAAAGGGGVAGVVVKLSCRCHLLPHHTFLPWRWFADLLGQVVQPRTTNQTPLKHVSTPSLSRDSAIRKLNGSDGLVEARTRTSDKMETWNDRDAECCLLSRISHTQRYASIQM